MAKMRDLFLGCPVTMKGGDKSNVYFVATIDLNDNTVWISGDFYEGWYKPSELVRVPYPDAKSVGAHLNKFNIE